MKCSEEHVREAISGDRGALWTAFVWGESPQGNDYWHSQAKGETPIDVGYLKSLLGEDEKEKEMIGTLKELDVKPGDVVECVHRYGVHTVGKKYTILPNGSHIDDTGGEWLPAKHGYPSAEFKIISRASEKPKTWGEMTDVEKGALLLAAHEGKVIECYDSGKWYVTRFVSWANGVAYRVRPEPNRETVTLYAGHVDPDCDPMPIGTINLIDGKPDFTSIKKGENK